MSEPTISVCSVPKTRLKKITLKNDYLTVVLLNYGARLHQIFAPDKNGRMENILLSYDHLDDVLADKSYFGATVGPVAGRIRNGSWDQHQLEKNCGDHHIHGGSDGWSFQYWEVEIFKTPVAIGVVFYLKDTSSGYPGPITTTVTYRLINDTLEWTTTASSDCETICNPTNHAYFNLSGDGKRDIDTHRLTVYLDGLLALDTEKLPTGKLIEQEKLPVRFKQPTSMKEIFSHFPNGLDDVFVLHNPRLSKTSLVLAEKESGRQLSIATTNKSMVLFSTTGFDADLVLNGKKMHSNYGLAIEPQEFPDLVHLPDLGSISLHPGQERISQTIYQFSAH
ncbi:MULTISPECIES: aldose epimerase family protein [unclassified Enterococcus]|uniref:aldose epimerase family protein n=1 Tax=unclassified Enterococcus TaxID=2608891 RepID=UPI0013EA3D24|nr:MULTISPECIES: aldose epimerase family protein [unclassified Enterococcus]